MNPQEFQQVDLEGYAPLIAAIRAVKIPVSTVPTYTPTNLIEQFVLYKSGATYGVYVWFGVTDGWRLIS
jgi:hypothetical protein